MYSTRREQALSAIASAAIVVLFAAMLVLGLRASSLPSKAGALVSVDFAPPPPDRDPPPPEPRRTAASAPKNAPSPRNLKNEATPIVAPPVIPLIVPPPIATAPVAGGGAATNQGASNLPGTGQGAGGSGNGLGGGGTGGDGDGVPAVGPRQIRGKLSYRDIPAGLLQPGQQARVGVRYTVNVDGRISGCIVDEPSGLAVADALTCRLIEQRFVYRPARDRAGRAVRSIIVETHTWFSREQS
ncbi:MAG TPA: energy transducer TonB [Novosphingobium sp.]|nr:energy transducer TonB [Novosphingobium sp.]